MTTAPQNAAPKNTVLKNAGLKTVLGRVMLTTLVWGSCTLSASAQAPKQCKSAPDMAPSATAATVKIDGKEVKITVGELDASIADELCSARRAWQQQVYDLRSGAVEEMVDRKLLEAEAKSRKLADMKALIQAEMAKVPEPKEAEVKALYEEYKDRMQGAKFDEVKADIASYLKEQAQEARVNELVQGLRGKAGLMVALEPWRVDRGPIEAGPSRGPADAPITIVEFADFECPFCAKGAEVVEEVAKKYPGKVKVVFRDYPLGFHPQAVPAAVAARCAGKQGKFWAAYDALFALDAELPEGAIEKALAEIKGLDMKALKACQASDEIKDAVAADAAVGSAAGVEGTPAFFINGIPLSGAQPLEAFSAIIDRELAKKAK
ncbi:MAG: thioredoxin domain-containing protein [Bradymonadia bacterium]